jgi:hypothetical protein
VAPVAVVALEFQPTHLRFAMAIRVKQETQELLDLQVQEAQELLELQMQEIQVLWEILDRHH